MPKIAATAFWSRRAAQTAASAWPKAVAVAMMGIEAAPAVAGTKPVSTSPRAVEPTRNVGTPTRAGLPGGAATASSWDMENLLKGVGPVTLPTEGHRPHPATGPHFALSDRAGNPAVPDGP